MNKDANKTISVEVIMAAYNNETFTQATLKGFTRQSCKDFSIAIADDGSSPDASHFIDKFRHSLNIRHIWQEDKGFRKALILNKAIATSPANYLVFIDNDCIPHKDFIKDHIMNAAPGHAVTGRRVNLKSHISRIIINNPKYIALLENTFTLSVLIAARFIKDGERGFRLPSGLRALLPQKKRGLLGSNMAIWKSDLLSINGFDSSFTGYGEEETDLEWRLEANGVSIRSATNNAIQYHLYHKQKKCKNTNQLKIESKKKNHIIVSPNGIRESDSEANR